MLMRRRGGRGLEGGGRGVAGVLSCEYVSAGPVKRDGGTRDVDIRI